MKHLFKLLKGAGWLNLLGMSVAFAAIYIILVQVNFDLGYNKNIKDADRMYVLATPDWFEEGKYGTNTNRPMSKAMLDSSPLVEEYGVLFENMNYNMVLEKGKQRQEVTVALQEMTHSALHLFGFEAVAGTFGGMDHEATVAVSESTAQTWGIGLGDVLHFTDERLGDATVTAIFKDYPENTIVGKAEVICCHLIETESLDNWSQWSYQHYVKLKSAKDVPAWEKTALVEAQKSLMDMVDGIPEDEKPTQAQLDVQMKKINPKLFPITEMYYSQELTNLKAQGNKTTVYMLLLIAGLTLIITLVNYVNFFMAQIPLQLRAVNTRKILGSSRTALVLRFMAEAEALVILALLLAYIPILLFKQSDYANFISCSLDWNRNLTAVGVTFTTALLLTLAASLYPALYVTSFPTALALKGSMGSAQKGKTFRFVLVGVQFVISMTFLICTGLLKDQYHTLMHYDMGFDKENLFSVDLPVDQNNQTMYTEELKKHPAIQDIAWSDFRLVGNNPMSWGRNIGDKRVNFTVQPVSYNFLSFMGIELTEGRDFCKSDEQCANGVLIFNETARHIYDLKLGNLIPGHADETEIVGFCKDFHFRSLQHEVGPYAFYIYGKNPWRTPSHLYIRTSAHTEYQELLKAVKETVAKLSPEYNTEKLQLNFFDDELGIQYAQTQKLIQLVMLFSLLTIVISLMGIVGLLLFETNYRRKEIGIRRVHGATVMEILQLFNRRYLKILLVSFIVAAPMSYYLADYYYSTFTYRAPIHAWIFVAALAAVLLVTVSVVTLCCYRAASANPAESIQNE